MQRLMMAMAAPTKGTFVRNISCIFFGCCSHCCLWDHVTLNLLEMMKKECSFCGQLCTETNACTGQRKSPSLHQLSDSIHLSLTSAVEKLSLWNLTSAS